MKALLIIALFATLSAWRTASAQTQATTPSPAAAQVQPKLRTANPLGTQHMTGSAQTPTTGGCTKCAVNAKSSESALEGTTSRPIPGTNETMLVGRVENLIPI